MKKRISIIGIQSIPAKYGGFETLVQYITQNLGKSFDLKVYCSKRLFAPKAIKYYNNTRLYYIPIKANGPQSVAYDCVSILHAIFSSDILLVLGVSGAILFPFVKLFTNKKIIVNIDGVEYKRDKWNRFAKKYLKLAENLAVKFADIVISDNLGIQDYVTNSYKKQSELIAYGGDHVKHRKLEDVTIDKYKLPKKYAFKVCRIEPENNINIILEAFLEFDNYPIVMVGNWNNSDYGKKLFLKYSKYKSLILLDPIYNQDDLNQLRSNCYIYIHGHSAGGTNPSLVEAMYLKLPVVSYDIIFNRQTTNEKALFFANKEELLSILFSLKPEQIEKVSNDLYTVAEKNYKWKKISAQYEKIFNDN